MGQVPCTDEPGFLDANGLPCSDWVGWNCSASEDGDLYTEEDLDYVQIMCPVSCGYCDGAGSAASTIKVEDAWLVSSIFDIFSLDVAEAQLVTKGIGVALSETCVLPVENIDVEVVQVDEDADVDMNTSSSQTGSGRRLQEVEESSRARSLRVRCNITVPPSDQALRVVKAVTQLDQDATAANGFWSTFERETGEDAPEAMLDLVSIEAWPVSASFQKDLVLISDVVIRDIHAEKSSVDDYSIVVTKVGCVDNSLLLDDQGGDCQGWIGYDCFDGNWLSTDQPFSRSGLNEVQEQCLVACRVCSPADRKNHSELLNDCEDDDHSLEFCRRWVGRNCSDATTYGFSDYYQRMLLELCPMSCLACDLPDDSSSNFSSDGNTSDVRRLSSSTAMARLEAVCYDLDGFRDELGFSCQEWVGFDCAGSYHGYSPLGTMAVHTYCRKSCGLCKDEVIQASTPETVKLWDGGSCRDDPSYRAAGSLPCSHFIGKACLYSETFLEPRWLAGSAGIIAWQEELWAHCPLTCGMCEPDGKLSDDHLSAECEDDPLIDSWCRYHWSGNNCDDWKELTVLGRDTEDAQFETLMNNRCPKSCSRCTEPWCSAGAYRNATLHTCELCPHGRYNGESRRGTEARACLPARRGFAVPTEGALEDTPCDVGTFSPAEAQASCTSCVPGKAAATRGSSECAECPAGFYQPEEAAGSCERCPIGRFQTSEGATFCEACPATYATNLTGQTSLADCVCAAGTHVDATSGRCVPCPPGFGCQGGAREVDEASGLDPTMFLLPGMMSLAEEPLSAYACIGGDVACPENRLPGFNSGYDVVCGGDRIGTRCGSCEPGFFEDEEKESCQPCPAGTFFEKYWRVFASAALLLYGTHKCYSTVCDPTWPPEAMLWSGISFLQFIKAMQNLPVKWPHLIVKVFSWLGFLQYFTFIEDLLAFNSDCVFGTDVFIRMLRDVVGPLIPILCFIPVSIFIRVWTGSHLDVNKMLGALGDIYASVFVQVAVIVLQAFPTEEMPNGKHFLKFHPRIEYGSDEWKRMLPASLWSVLIYGAGYMTFVAWGIWYLPKIATSRSRIRYVFLYMGFRAEFYWWRGLAMVYAFFFALSNAFSSDVYARVYSTMACNVCFCLFEIAARPRKVMQINFLRAGMQIGMVFLLALAVALIETDTIDLEAHRKNVSVFSMMILSICGGLVTFWIIEESFQTKWRPKEREEHAKNLIAGLEFRLLMEEGLTIGLQDLLKAASAFSDHDTAVFRRWNAAFAADFLQCENAAGDVSQSSLRRSISGRRLQRGTKRHATTTSVISATSTNGGPLSPRFSDLVGGKRSLWTGDSEAEDAPGAQGRSEEVGVWRSEIWHSERKSEVTVASTETSHSHAQGLSQFALCQQSLRTMRLWGKHPDVHIREMRGLPKLLLQLADEAQILPCKKSECHIVTEEEAARFNEVFFGWDIDRRMVIEELAQRLTAHQHRPRASLKHQYQNRSLILEGDNDLDIAHIVVPALKVYRRSFTSCKDKVSGTVEIAGVASSTPDADEEPEAEMSIASPDEDSHVIQIQNTTRSTPLLGLASFSAAPRDSSGDLRDMAGATRSTEVRQRLSTQSEARSSFRSSCGGSRLVSQISTGTGAASVAKSLPESLSDQLISVGIDVVFDRDTSDELEEIIQAAGGPIHRRERADSTETTDIPDSSVTPPTSGYPNVCAGDLLEDLPHVTPSSSIKSGPIVPC